MSYAGRDGARIARIAPVEAPLHGTHVHHELEPRPVALPLALALACLPAVRTRVPLAPVGGGGSLHKPLKTGIQHGGRDDVNGKHLGQLRCTHLFYCLGV